MCVCVCVCVCCERYIYIIYRQRERENVCVKEVREMREERKYVMLERLVDILKGNEKCDVKPYPSLFYLIRDVPWEGRNL